MKFPTHVRVLGGVLDVAPFISVFFLLVMFALIGPLIYTPGLHLELPAAPDLPGTDRPTITVALDAHNQLFFAHQRVTEAELKSRLAAAVAGAPEPLTLVVQADKAVTHESLTRLRLLARDAGIHDALLAVLPRLIAAPNGAAPERP